MAERAHTVRSAALIALCLALAACNAGGRPKNAPASKPMPVATGPVVDPADFGKTLGGSYVVAPGDTLAAVSDRTGTSIRSLIDINHLQPPYAMTPGMRLALQPGVQYSAQDNGAQALPPPATPAGSVSSMPLPGSVATTTIAPKPLSVPIPSTSTSSVSAQSLPPPAPLPAATTPKPIVTPNAASAPQASVVPLPALPSQPVTTAPKPAAAPVQQPAATVPDTDGETAAASVSGPAAGSGKGLFVWPVQGKVIGTFGSSKDGTKNDGINIAAPSGAPVVAAADGVVAYAGNELRGFGNMVLIRHDSGYVTAYAHNASLLVKKGDTVKRGQTIARVGATGAVFGPQLHFEIRKGTQPVDPMTFLGG